MSALVKFAARQSVAFYKRFFPRLFKIAREQVTVLFFRAYLLRKQSADGIIIFSRGFFIVILLVKYIEGNFAFPVDIISALRAVRVIPALRSGEHVRPLRLGIRYGGNVVFVNAGGRIVPRKLYYRAYFVAVQNAVVFARLADKRGNVVFMRMRCDNILYFSVGTIFIYVILYFFLLIIISKFFLSYNNLIFYLFLKRL